MGIGVSEEITALILRAEDGGAMIYLNVDTHLQDHTTSHPRRPSKSWLPLKEIMNSPYTVLFSQVTLQTEAYIRWNYNLTSERKNVHIHHTDPLKYSTLCCIEASWNIAPYSKLLLENILFYTDIVRTLYANILVSRIITEIFLC